MRSDVSLCCSLPCVLKQGLSLTLISPDGYTSWRQETRSPPCPSPQCWGCRHRPPCSSHGSGIELRSCAHTADTELPRAISPAGLILFTSCGFKYCFVSPVSVGTKSLTAFTDCHGSVGSVVIACPCHLYFLFLLISFMKIFRELFFH